MTKSGRESDVKSRECECLHVGRKLSFRLPRYKSLLSLLQTPKADRRQTAQLQSAGNTPDFGMSISIY